MKVTQRVSLDRIASSTRNAALPRDVLLSDTIHCAEGYVIAARILNDKSQYNVLEDVHGRFMAVRSGDIIAGTLGPRNALRGYAGRVPAALRRGDRIQVLNIGGVLGECTSMNFELGPPFEAEVLGSVLTFPGLDQRHGTQSHIRRGAIAPKDEFHARIPMILIAGTCMNSGKTVAAAEVVRGLHRSGRRVAGLKLTGVSLRRDTLAMVDAGAVEALTFTDTGIVTTQARGVVECAYGLIDALEERVQPDVIVAELGDGLFGEYGVETLLLDRPLMERCAGLVLCAPDPVAAWGADRWLREVPQRAVDVVSGPVTDNEVGSAFVERTLGVPAFNARFQAGQLVEILAEKLHVCV
jgi:hypothetical protein